jgi:hypothetical protein
MLHPETAIDSTKRKACAQKKLSLQIRCKASDIYRDLTFLDKQADFSSSQILHYERFF